MTLWAEAWDLPHLATPGKKVAYIPVLQGRFGRHADAFREEGSVEVPAAWNRLDDVLTIDTADHSNDVGSVIHLYQRDVLGADSKPIVVGSFVAERYPESLASKAVASTEISGRGLTSYFLDRVRLWARDYPANPTAEDDWIFGGENILTNPGLEDGDLLSAEWAVWMEDDVASGTWQINIGGDLTDPFAWDVSAADIRTEVIDAIPGLIDLTVSGSGTEEDPWVLTVTDPSGEAFPSFTAVDIDLGPGAATVLFETIHSGGTGRQLEGWERSQNLDRGGREHGLYSSDGFRLTTSGEPVRTGAYALRINGLTRYAGAQQRVNVIPGHTYTASVWVFTSSATNIFRFVIRDKYDGFIGGPQGLGGITIPINTWTEFTFTFVAPTDMVIMRIAVVGDTVDGPAVNPSPFYVDDGSMAPGIPATTIGDILLQMKADADVDHAVEAGREALTFITPTFDETLDSAGAAWDSVRKMTLGAGDTYGQIAEAMQRLWGYVIRIRFDREDNVYYWDAFNPGYMAFDHSTTGTTGTLMSGMNIRAGEAIRRAPEATAWQAFTDEGEWQEDTDAALQPSWGWADGPVTKVAAFWDELPDILTAGITTNREQMVSIEVDAAPKAQVIPLQHIDIFHKVRVNLGGANSIVPQDLIVTSIVTSFKPGAAPSYQVFVNSDAFASTGAAALAEAVRRLLRRGTRDKKDFGGTVSGGGGAGVPRIVLGALLASERSRAKSDFVSDGGNEEEIFEIALTEGIGEVRLTEGVFAFQGDHTIPTGIYISGAGRGATAIDAGAEGEWEWTGNSGIRFVGAPGCIPG